MIDDATLTEEKEEKEKKEVKEDKEDKDMSGGEEEKVVPTDYTPGFTPCHPVSNCINELCRIPEAAQNGDVKKGAGCT